jgi:hypothetical protein
MRRLVGIFVCGMVAAVTSGHDVITTPITFSREISRLIYNRCAHCHRSGGAAFSLMTYAEARPWAAAIKEEVLQRRMPPWGAVKGFGEFKDDQGLTQEQIELIADWVEGGAPEGDPALLPKTLEFAGERAARLQPGIPVDGALTLKTAITLAGIQPQKVLDGGSAMVTATRPDGSVEPLLWLYNYNPAFAHVYWYKAGLRLEAATRIEVTPPGAAMVELVTKAPPISSHR